LDRIFEAIGYNDEKNLNVASLKFTRYASLCFEKLKKQRVKDGKRRINSFDKLKILMNKISKVINKSSSVECSHSSKTILSTRGSLNKSSVGGCS